MTFSDAQIVEIKAKIEALETKEYERMAQVNRIIETKQALYRLLDGKDIDGTTLSDVRETALKSNLFTKADTLIS